MVHIWKSEVGLSMQNTTTTHLHGKDILQCVHKSVHFLHNAMLLISNKLGKLDIILKSYETLFLLNV